MTEWLETLKKAWLLNDIEAFYQSNSFGYWSILAASILLLYLLIRYIDVLNSHFPPYSYYGVLLFLVGFLDLFTIDFPIIILYAFLVGISLLFLHRENHYILLGITLGVYFAMHLYMIWSFPRFLELASHMILLTLISWAMKKLQRSEQKIQCVNSDNLYLLEKLRKSSTYLKKYNEEIEETYRKDYLTGLYNLTAFKELVSTDLERCRHSNKEYFVISIDLIDFKQVNVREGIERGDQILVKLAQLLRQHLPSHALLARYDGDQFAIGMEGDSKTYRKCLEVIFHVMEEVRTGRTLIDHKWASATFPSEAENADDLIRLAEQRLTLLQRQSRHEEEEKKRHLEKLSAVGQLAAGLAHEIRNPLTSIRGFVQISAAESEALKKWESIIIPEIDRINDLLKQFLNLSEVKPAKFTVFNLDQLMNDVISLLQPKALLMGRELRASPLSKPITLEADAEQLKQVLINLIQNGLDAIEEKGHVSLIWKEQNGSVLIRVEDNGNGIKPEDMNRIFDPFFTTKDEGTGMGLSICNRIITDHGGQIRVTSLPGKGTKFHIQLPVRQSMVIEQDHLSEGKKELTRKSPTYLFRPKKQGNSPFFASGN